VKDLDELDEFNDFDDFRVQGKPSTSKPKKPKKPKRNKRKMGQEQSNVTDDTPPLSLPERSLPAVAQYVKSGRARRVVVMTGAGISTAAGSMSPSPLYLSNSLPTVHHH
jgi:hypothetical protein